MIFSSSHGTIAQALIAVQREIQPVVKDAENPLLRSRYATLGAITDYVRPLLAKYELSVLQGISDEHYHPTTGVLLCFAVETTLLHLSGEWVRNRVIVPVQEIGKEERRTTAQTAGSSITYGRRFGLSAILALTTDEDNDGAGGPTRVKTRQRSESLAAPRSVAQAKQQVVTQLGDLPFPRLKGLEEFEGKKFSDVPDEKIGDGLKITSVHTGKNAKQLTKAFEDYLEARRFQNDFTQPLPPEPHDGLDF